MAMNRKDPDAPTNWSAGVSTFTQRCLSDYLVVTLESGLRLKEGSKYMVT